MQLSPGAPVPGTERPAIGGGAVFAEAGGVLHALDARTRAEFWGCCDSLRSVSGVRSAYVTDGRDVRGRAVFARLESSDAGSAVKPFSVPR